MKARHLAIFEQPISPLDAFIGEAKAYEEITKAWIHLDTNAILAQRTEFVESQQSTQVRKHVAKCTWTPTMATITTGCRMRIERQDGTSRVFGIDAIVNVDERNRELQMQLVERN